MAAKFAFRRSFVRHYSEDLRWHPNYHDHGDVEKGMNMWKNLTLFIALPTCIIAGINTFLKLHEEEKTLQRPEYIPYEHLRIINKPFPWGDGKHSFFHNPHRNAVPGIGYEEDWPHH